MRHTRLFECTVDWNGDNLEYDVGMAIGEIENNLTPVLENVGAELINDLQKHIERDVYAKYSPISYPRRRDFPRFGTPLTSIKNFSTKVSNELNTATLEFDYSPDGTHKGQKKDALDYDEEIDEKRNGGKTGNRPLKPNPVHGDALIRRIETGEGYDWKSDVPARPFWDKFITQEMQGGGIRRYFNTYMSNQKLTSYDYEYKSQRGDFTYDYNDSMSIADRVFDEEEDDLPF